MSEIKKEPFAWINPNMEILQGLDKRFLVKVVAKTPQSTNHTNDPTTSDKVRIYTPVEMHEAARSLAFRHIDVNHDLKRIIPNAFVVDAQFNLETGCVESLCYIPSFEYIRKLKEGIIKNVSVEEFNREDVETAQGTELKGIIFTGLALVDPTFDSSIVAGDTATSLQMFEAMKGFMCEITKVESYESKIEKQESTAQTEEEKAKAKKAEEDAEKARKEAEEKAKKPDPNPVEIKIKDLEAAVTRLQEQALQSDKKLREEIAKAKKEGKSEIIEKLEKVLPDCVILRQGNNGMIRLTQDVKRVIKEESE